MLAQQTIDPDDRRTLSNLAEQWMRLAKDFEGQNAILDTIQEIKSTIEVPEAKIDHDSSDGHSQT